jgi:hypothetical protein
LIFVRDSEGQTLYITEPASKVIIFFRMSVQNLLNSERCGEVLDSKINQMNSSAAPSLMSGQSRELSQQMQLKVPQQKQMSVKQSSAGNQKQRNQAMKAGDELKDKGQEQDKVKQAQVISEYCNIDN